MDEHCEAVAAQGLGQGVVGLTPRDVSAILALTGDEIRRLPADELASYAWDVGVAAHFAQDQTNRVKIRVDKLTAEINRRVYPKAGSYPAFKFEDQVLLAIYDDPIASEMQRLRDVARDYLTLWGRQAAHLGDAARRLDTAHHEKIGKRY